MKNYEDLDINFYEFVKNNLHQNPRELYLKVHAKEYPFPAELGVVQIECRKKTSSKLEEYIRDVGFIFPSVQVAEQSTHQAVAGYHAKIAGKGKRILDMTGGLGIDSFSMCRGGNNVICVELDSERAGAIAHNSKHLNIENIDIIEGDSIKYLEENPEENYDIIFVDPARRDVANRRTYFFKDCLPDILSHFEVIKRRGKRMMVKGSPILDPRQISHELPGVTEIHIVCVKGECKEVLAICNLEAEGFSEDFRIIIADIMESSEVKLISSFSLMASDAGSSGAPLATEDDIRSGRYLYDPNAGLHKIRCANEICRQFEGMKRIGINTDLYISDIKYKDFPGRVFEIEYLPTKKDYRNLKGTRADVAERNYPLSADQLRNKLKLKSDETNYVIACRAYSKDTPILIKCRKLEK